MIAIDKKHSKPEYFYLLFTEKQLNYF